MFVGSVVYACHSSDYGGDVVMFERVGPHDFLFTV